MTVTERIQALKNYPGKTPCPEDFAEVWEEKYNRISLSSLSREQVCFQNPAAVYEQLTVKASDGRDLPVRYIRPAEDGPFPTLLMFHDLGRPCRGWHHMTRFAALGYAVVALQNRVNSDFTMEQMEDELLGQCYLDALTAAKAALALPQTDRKHLSTWGEGFGGGLAMAAAALLGGDTRCACLHPMPAEWHTPYLDIENFATLLRGPLLMGTAMMDSIACPEGQFAAFNRAACPKQHLIYPKYVHERINAFENEHIKFLNFWSEEENH